MTTTKLPTDLPEGHLQIGGVRFYQFFQDMNVNVPTDWDILEDPIYYTTINGQVVLYNDITRELVTESQTTLEPCTTVETPQDDVTESQDNQYSVYEVSTIEGNEDDQPEYCIHEVTSYSLDSAIEIVKYRLTAQSIRFKILGVCEVVPKVENDEWLEF
jgi:hypothetical protein